MIREIDWCLVFSDVRTIATVAAMTVCVGGLVIIAWIGVAY